MSIAAARVAPERADFRPALPPFPYAGLLPEKSMSEDWDYWYRPNDAIVVAPVDPIAVYTNDEGSIVIRQKDGIQDEDLIVVIPKQYAQAVIDAIKKELQDTQA